MNSELRGARPLFALVVLSLLILAGRLPAAHAFEFSDIEFWVGDGPNQATLVIDWHDGSTAQPALAWGFRWNGTAKGADMLSAIVAADDRLFAKLGGAPGNVDAIYGIGYEFDFDGQFATDDFNAQFDEQGLAYGDPIDGVESVNPDDFYAEGWEVGFWHYGVGIGNPYNGGSWLSSPVGFSNRTLSNGAWDGWTFMEFVVPPFTAFPNEPSPAPLSSIAGDYNHDGKVGAADYTMWRDSFSATVSVPGASADGNGNSLVDFADWEVWASNYGQSATSSSFVASTTVPETATIDLFFLSIVCLAIWRRSAPGWLGHRPRETQLGRRWRSATSHRHVTLQFASFEKGTCS